MSAPEYLWPARPEYLRRGTPVMLRRTRRWEGHVWRYDLIPLRDQVHLDLRDLTARAHAAMAYTCVAVDDDALFTVALSDALGRQVRGMHARTLTRMRMLDETVTVAEARAALDWAHAASGGGR